jgi:hypothetical protein
MRLRLILGGLLLLVALAAGVAWVERTPLLSWYYLRGLTRADDKDVSFWQQRLVALDATAVRGLINCLRHNDPRACNRAGACLIEICTGRAANDPGHLRLAVELARAFPTLSTSGQTTALEVETSLMSTAEGQSLAALVPLVARTLTTASRGAKKEVRASALALASNLVNRHGEAEVLQACREVAKTCLRDESAMTRIAAIRLCMRPEFDLLECVVPLLSDPEPEIRRCALLAVGMSQTAINTDDLLPWLHDPDAGVRNLCEEALRGRGLHDGHLKLARLMTDGRPGTRLGVLELLEHANDLEPGLWLRRLSHDPSPAVRAAAVRAACEQATGLTDRLQQMSQNDPSPTVRQLAQYYLSAPKGLEPDSGAP